MLRQAALSLESRSRPVRLSRSLSTASAPPSFIPPQPRFSQRPPAHADSSTSEISSGPSSDLPEDESSAGTTGAGRPARVRYECLEPGCYKTFSTSGHRSRHHKIHRGEAEKKWACPFVGCSSKFTRKDNQTQHYKTHFPRTKPPRSLKLIGRSRTSPATATSAGLTRDAEESSTPAEPSSPASESPTRGLSESSEMPSGDGDLSPEVGPAPPSLLARRNTLPDISRDDNSFEARLSRIAARRMSMVAPSTHQVETALEEWPAAVEPEMVPQEAQEQSMVWTAEPSGPEQSPFELLAEQCSIRSDPSPTQPSVCSSGWEPDLSPSAPTTISLQSIEPPSPDQINRGVDPAELFLAPVGFNATRRAYSLAEGGSSSAFRDEYGLNAFEAGARRWSWQSGVPMPMPLSPAQALPTNPIDQAQIAYSYPIQSSPVQEATSFNPASSAMATSRSAESAYQGQSFFAPPPAAAAIATSSIRSSLPASPETLWECSPIRPQAVPKLVLTTPIASWSAAPQRNAFNPPPLTSWSAGVPLFQQPPHSPWTPCASANPNVSTFSGSPMSPPSSAHAIESPVRTRFVETSALRGRQGERGKVWEGSSIYPNQTSSESQSP